MQNSPIPSLGAAQSKNLSLQPIYLTLSVESVQQTLNSAPTEKNINKTYFAENLNHWKYRIIGTN